MGSWSWRRNLSHTCVRIARQDQGPTMLRAAHRLGKAKTSCSDLSHLPLPQESTNAASGPFTELAIKRKDLRWISVSSYIGLWDQTTGRKL